MTLIKEIAESHAIKNTEGPTFKVHPNRRDRELSNRIATPDAAIDIAVCGFDWQHTVCSFDWQHSLQFQSPSDLLK